nr:reverse transcriptase domain-containing protein [Tanacetum cinerariifolium]
MFKQLHINITLADALILILKCQNMLKALLSNKEKLLELVNIPLNENCSAVILKKLLEKLGDPGKSLILCGFSELKYKALAVLGARINLMPLSVWKNLDLFAINHLSVNPTFSSHTDLTSPEVINQLSGNTTSSSPDHLVEEFADELALITFPPGNDDLLFDTESDLRNRIFA